MSNAPTIESVAQELVEKFDPLKLAIALIRAESKLMEYEILYGTPGAEEPMGIMNVDLSELTKTKESSP